MSSEQTRILDKCIHGLRITVEEALFLYRNSTTGQLGFYADIIRRKKHNNKAYYIRNYHIEPTNICVYGCKFCSFSVSEKAFGWEKKYDDIIEEVKRLPPDIKELHITGGSNNTYNLEFYSTLFKNIKIIRSDIHIKGLSASEIHYISQISDKQYSYVLKKLKDSGLDSIAGGGAEIFAQNIRNQICCNKLNAEQWLDIHRTAHIQQIKSNATMLYGHIETVKQRFEHKELIRQLQDETKGFSAFIPLKFRNKNNKLSHLNETKNIEDIKMFALSRLFFDNIKHLKVYWPAFDKQFASLAISFGADDIDGTIENTTKIYSMAGGEEKNPAMTVVDLCNIIRTAGYEPQERDSKYQTL